jgi:hypothetical protein
MLEVAKRRHRDISFQSWGDFRMGSIQWAESGADKHEYRLTNASGKSGSMLASKALYGNYCLGGLGSEPEAFRPGPQKYLIILRICNVVVIEERKFINCMSFC